MSIHRPKRVTYRSTRDTSGSIETQKEAKQLDWADAVQGKPAKDFKPYTVTTTYVQGDLLTHPKFGEGVVAGVEPGKIEVLFESGPRKLAHSVSG